MVNNGNVVHFKENVISGIPQKFLLKAPPENESKNIKSARFTCSLFMKFFCLHISAFIVFHGYCVYITWNVHFQIRCCPHFFSSFDQILLVMLPLPRQSNAFHINYSMWLHFVSQPSFRVRAYALNRNANKWKRNSGEISIFFHVSEFLLSRTSFEFSLRGAHISRSQRIAPINFASLASRPHSFISESHLMDGSLLVACCSARAQAKFKPEMIDNWFCSRCGGSWRKRNFVHTFAVSQWKFAICRLFHFSFGVAGGRRMTMR